jgi:hypothetical protein
VPFDAPHGGPQHLNRLEDHRIDREHVRSLLS